MKNTQLDFLEPHERAALEAIMEQRKARWALAKRLWEVAYVRITLYGLLVASATAFFIGGVTAFIALTMVVPVVGGFFFAVWGTWTIGGCLMHACNEHERKAYEKRIAEREAEYSKRYRNRY